MSHLYPGLLIDKPRDNEHFSARDKDLKRKEIKEDAGCFYVFATG
jgi:hypothetical protein